MEDFKLKSLPYYPRVPKDPIENLKFRKKVIQRCMVDEEARAEQWMACSRDPLYYFNTFLWLYEPREASALPWITYDFQDEDIIKKINAIGEKDLFQTKCRDMGASWDTLGAIHWYWTFRKMCSFLLVSWKEDLVDKAGWPASLFWKFDFLHDPRYVPSWLIPNFYRTNNHIENLDLGSVVDGESTTADTGRAGRYTAIFPDEIAKMPNGLEMWEGMTSVTDSRIAVTTPRGTNNCAFEIANSGVDTHDLDWWMHPRNRKGLYRVVQGKVEIIDKKFKFPEAYRFIRSESEALEWLKKPAFWEGEYRSPWFDKECRRFTSLRFISQEIRRDFVGSGSAFFDGINVNDYITQYCQPPWFRANLIFDDYTFRLKEMRQSVYGQFEFWIQPDGQGNFPRDRRFGIGCDISQGRGASNSAASVVDLLTGETVCQFVHPKTTPTQFARLMVVLGRMFAGNDQSGAALVVYEVNGPGLTFGEVMYEAGYQNLFFRDSKDEHGKLTRKAGWHCGKETKLSVFDAYHMALQEGRFLNRSDYAVKEIGCFSTDPTGLIVHKKADNEDPSGAKDNHGDIVVANALANLALEKYPDRPIQRESEVPPDCLAARKQEFDIMEAAKQDEDWYEPNLAGKTGGYPAW